MDYLEITGGNRLEGTIEISGSKNAALPMLAASILADETVTLTGVPDLSDTLFMSQFLSILGVKVVWDDEGTVRCTVTDAVPVEAPYRIVRKMRGSICVLGPLLAKRGHARVSLPGGCNIGVRPIDLHLKGLKALGARIKIEGGYVEAQARRLRGANIYLGGRFGPSVLATANVMCAATLASGTTVIDGAACEPEIADLADMLNLMGARITGAGTPRLQIEGVKRLGGAQIAVISDRIEAGTFMIAAAITGGRVTLKNVNLDHLGAVVDKLQDIGVTVNEGDGYCTVTAPRRVHATDVTTLSFPGFPTDLQAQMLTLLSLSDGISIVTEKVFPDRFMHVAELNRLGARITKEGPSAIVIGVERLSGAELMASDLRASAALVLAGLMAEGTTKIHRVYHIDRGYERIDEKLRSLGAEITRGEE